jgi:hypothetical protein
METEGAAAVSEEKEASPLTKRLALFKASKHPACAARVAAARLTLRRRPLPVAAAFTADLKHTRSPQGPRPLSLFLPFSLSLPHSLSCAHNYTQAHHKRRQNTLAHWHARLGTARCCRA